MDFLTCSGCGASYPVRETAGADTLRCLKCGSSLVLPRRPAPSLPPIPSSGAPPGSLGRYTLVRQLGRGGMGFVYEAVHKDSGLRVALKILDLVPSLDPKRAAQDEIRFVREARACAGVPRHPAIVAITNAGTADGKYFLEMEYVDGLPMNEWRRRKAPPLRRQVEVLRDVALALDHIHRHGLVHRDLKPENVLVDGEERPHVTDFGIAKILGDESSVTSGSGLLVGTPAYVSPEQAVKPRTADHRTDVYSLGVMLYESLTGLLPFTGRSTVSLLMSVMNDTPAAPSATPQGKANPLVNPGMDALCLRAMARKPEERFPTAAALADALTAWLA
jgi:serine/threonine protein kinase